MSTDDPASHHISGCSDYKQATLDYIVEMLGELASLALGIGEADMAESLRATANAQSVRLAAVGTRRRAASH